LPQSYRARPKRQALPWSCTPRSRSYEELLCNWWELCRSFDHFHQHFHSPWLIRSVADGVGVPSYLRETLAGFAAIAGRAAGSEEAMLGEPSNPWKNSRSRLTWQLTWHYHGHAPHGANQGRCRLFSGRWHAR
jgi:hypothetical protein